MWKRRKQDVPIGHHIFKIEMMKQEIYIRHLEAKLREAGISSDIAPPPRFGGGR